jgi:hypothetical protein
VGGRAAAELLPLVYDELRRLAAARLADEPSGNTLQPTALVHEAYLRLVGSPGGDHWNHRGHFYAAAAEAKGASPALVLRGAAKLAAGLATRSREVTAADLASADRAAWKQLRAELETRRERRVERRQFRRDPHGYLKALEDKLNQSRLPP